VKSNDRRRLVFLWLVPVVFLVHSVEQSVFISATIDAAKNGMPRGLRVMIPPVAAAQYVIALAFACLAAFAAAAWGRLESPRGFGRYALVFLTVALVCTAFGRVIASIILGRYTAGLVTAVALILPFSSLLFWLSLRERWFPQWVLTLLVMAGVIFHIPIFFGVLFFAGLLAR
jgi:hypothetical protein